MPKSKLSAFISLLLVFLSGALVGAMAHRLYMVNTVVSSRQPPPRRDPEDVKRQIMAETREKVKLDDGQVRKLDQIYEEERAQFGQLRQSWNEQGRELRKVTADKIKDMLRPDQVPLFEQLQADRTARQRSIGTA